MYTISVTFNAVEIEYISNQDTYSFPSFENERIPERAKLTTAPKHFESIVFRQTAIRFCEIPETSEEESFAATQRSTRRRKETRSDS